MTKEKTKESLEKILNSLDKTIEDMHSLLNKSKDSTRIISCVSEIQRNIYCHRNEISALLRDVENFNSFQKNCDSLFGIDNNMYSGFCFEEDNKDKEEEKK